MGLRSLLYRSSTRTDPTGAYYPSEENEDGNLKLEHQMKLGAICWKVHTGEEFCGPIEPFGRLCDYHSPDHPMMSNARPDMFLGWHIMSGMRFRGALLIADYEAIRGGKFTLRQIIEIHYQEVVFPDEIVFPFANAHKLAIHNMGPTPDLPDVPPLPFQRDVDDEVKTIDVDNVTLADLPPFKITLSRMMTYNLTDGCPACENIEDNTVKHTDECRLSFGKQLHADAKLPLKKALPPADAPASASTADGRDRFSGHTVVEDAADDVSSAPISPAPNSPEPALLSKSGANSSTKSNRNLTETTHLPNTHFCHFSVSSGRPSEPPNGTPKADFEELVPVSFVPNAFEPADAAVAAMPGVPVFRDVLPGLAHVRRLHPRRFKSWQDVSEAQSYACSTHTLQKTTGAIRTLSKYIVIWRYSCPACRPMLLCPALLGPLGGVWPVKGSARSTLKSCRCAVKSLKTCAKTSLVWQTSSSRKAGTFHSSGLDMQLAGTYNVYASLSNVIHCS